VSKGGGGLQICRTSIRKVPLIKDTCIRNQPLLGVRVVEQPSLVLLCIANKDTLLRVRSKALLLILLDVDIGSASKDSKPLNRGLLAIPARIRCSTRRKSSRRCSVVDINKGGNSKAPE
jgi:hypothetical protein